MGAHQDAIQGAVVLISAVMRALLDGTFDTLICMTIHRKSSFDIGYGHIIGRNQQIIPEYFSKLAFSPGLCYFIGENKMET